MSTRRRSIRSEIWERETVWTLALIERMGDGLPMQPSDVNSWALYVWDMSHTFQQVYALAAQAPSDAFSTTLRTAGWDGQAEGYNFARPFTPNDFALSGDRTYRLEYRIDTVSDGQTAVVHEVGVKGLYSA